jgi:hypothetical protein
LETQGIPQEFVKKIDGSNDLKQELRDYSKVVLRKPFGGTQVGN